MRGRAALAKCAAAWSRGRPPRARRGGEPPGRAGRTKSYALDPPGGQREVGQVLRRRPTSVDDDGLTVDETASLRTQERDGAREIFDPAQARVWRHLRVDLAEAFVGEPLFDHGRDRHAGRHRVAADALRPV